MRWRSDARRRECSVVMDVGAALLARAHATGCSSLAVVGTSKNAGKSVKVAKSKVSVNDPKTFWGCDAFEMFVDTANNKNQWLFADSGDHQFWFVPQVDKGNVYVGQWKVKNELPMSFNEARSVTTIGSVAARRT